MKNNKRFAPVIIILVILAVLIVGGAVYYAGKNSNRAITTNETADWKTTVQVYFSRTGDDEIEWPKTKPVLRIIPKTTKVGTAALEELLKGPTAEEKADGYTTNIPSGSKLNSLVIVNGEARADFNATTESGGGTTSMLARTNQIKKTLLQFPTIKNVTISIDGRTKDIFQP